MVLLPASLSAEAAIGTRHDDHHSNYYCAQDETLLIVLTPTDRFDNGECSPDDSHGNHRQNNNSRSKGDTACMPPLPTSVFRLT